MSIFQQQINQSFEKHSERYALSVVGKKYTYSDLIESVSTLISASEIAEEKSVAIWGDRSYLSYAAVAYALVSGKTFVPLNPAFPDKQNNQILALSETKVVIFDIDNIDAIKKLAERSQNALIFVTFSKKETTDQHIKDVKESFQKMQHEICILQIIQGQKVQLNQVACESYLYILFTSGTTGTPKGVPISHHNVEQYLLGLTELLELDENDKFTQIFDLTFDLSMHDIFLCWRVGGCLCVPGRLELVAPHKYIEKENITIWFSVPSVATLMQQMKLLSPNAYPNIKYSLFCGEALSSTLAKKFQDAAPNSQLINLYGPTEATIAFTFFQYDRSRSKEYVNGVVSIGLPFGQNQTSVRDHNMSVVKVEEEGELCLAGPQLTEGYLNNEVQNKDRFFYRGRNRGALV